VNLFNIALPIKPQILFTYRSEHQITKGCRVLVSFHNQIYTGIVWEEIKKPDPDIKIKPILEIIDDKPLILPDLLEIANWISLYYVTSLGIALSAMLPAAFNVQVQLQVRKIKCDLFDLDDISLNILDCLDFDDWTEISKLKSKLRSGSIHNLLEKLEDKHFIEIKRVFDNKIKKRTVNFIIRQNPEIIPELTPRQKFAYQTILDSDSNFPLSSIAKEFSYSIIKNLEKKQLIRIEPREIQDDADFTKKIQVQNKTVILNKEQLHAVNTIIQNIDQEKFNTSLLYGITGSGKTEVYIEVIKHAIKQNKTALMLVPEIALTPQMVSRFYGVFGNKIAVLHSHLNDREKWQQWRDIRSGRKVIVIGARSAIFAPLKNIGVLIVDEEHVNSYKQESNPRYNARDMAVLRAKINNAVCILGSATPSLESWFNVENKKFQLVELKNRPLSFELPEIEIVDLRKSELSHPNLSAKLLNSIEKRLEQKEQVLLLHNRRGYSSFVQCVSCGKMFECPQCDVSMNYHSSGEVLKCHYCGFSINLPRKCDDCGGYIFSFGVPGTQQLEKQLKIIFPQARILRMDSDTARKKDSYNSMFEKMRNGGVDILLGTQMIAKGLDFENVTLVGVILADLGLNIPDFRAGEITFQLLTQVAGRSGRGEKPGEVLIQTYNPDHYAISKALKQDYIGFSEKELSLREKLGYPPYRKLARILFTSLNENLLKKEMLKIHKLRQNLNKIYSDKQLIALGPVEAPFVKLQKKYRHHIILKTDSIKTMSEIVNYLKANILLRSTVKYSIDIDPLNLL